MRDVISIEATSERPVLRLRLWAELAGLALMLMEITWVTAFYFGLAAGGVPWPKIAVVLGAVALISHYLARGLNFFRTGLRTRRIVFVVWLLVAVFGSLRLLVFVGQSPSLWTLITRPFTAINEPGGGLAEFWHLALAAGLALRGVSLARAHVTIGQALRGFQIGLLAFLAYGVMLTRYAENRDYLTVFAFLFFAILAMASARIAGVSDLRGGKVGRFSRDWLAGILLAALTLAALAVLIGIVLRSPVGALMDTISLIVFIVLSLAVLVLTYPIVLLLTWLAPIIQEWLANIPALTAFLELQNMVADLAEQQTGVLEGLGQALNTGRMLGRVAIIALVLLAVLAALRWRPMLRRESDEEQVTDLPGGFWRPRIEINPGPGLARLLHGSRWLAAARIRRIYSELMTLCERLGHPRPAAATPLEFLPQMQTLFPTQVEGIATITQAYLGVRYGQLPETAEDLQAVLTAWEQVKGEGRRMKKAMRAQHD